MVYSTITETQIAAVCERHPLWQAVWSGQQLYSPVQPRTGHRFYKEVSVHGRFLKSL